MSGEKHEESSWEWHLDKQDPPGLPRGVSGCSAKRRTHHTIFLSPGSGKASFALACLYTGSGGQEHVLLSPRT